MTARDAASGGGGRPTDEVWFEDLFVRFHPAVRAYVARRAQAEADDVVADVFAVAWRKRLTVPEHPLPWLYAVAARETLHAVRGHVRRDRLQQRLVTTTDLVTQDEVDGLAERLDAQGPVDAALAQLSEPDVEILRLWAWEQLEPAEIAVVLDISAVTARVRLHRARRRLESHLLSFTTWRVRPPLTIGERSYE
ncbi:MAG: sigma-70 family RNA polymerase sigma factor [Humibacillus sp.]|nr:sigma-70 family RNA polymerase sigma factor [Humibacillus sp.]MDN5779161.1 sigma-70 family RNA polymerase sigma factor [Humibacillus sp.]